MQQAATYAPVITASVAVAAFFAAFYGIIVQRSTARKRAALDLFFKTELDRAMVDTYEKFNKAVESLRADTKMDDFRKTDEYRQIRSVLNIHELVAVGVHNKVLDKRVCFDFWSDELMDAYRNCKRIIEDARLEPKGTRFTYADLERLNTAWVRRHKKIVRKER